MSFVGVVLPLENIHRVRELFSEQQFGEELRAFFTRIETQMFDQGLTLQMRVGSDYEAAV